MFYLALFFGLLHFAGLALQVAGMFMHTALKREPGPISMVPYGDYDTMLKTLTDQLAKGPYLLGERMTAADVLWGTALAWTVMFKLVPELPVITDYVKRLSARPSVDKVKALDAKLAAEHEAAAKAAG